MPSLARAAWADFRRTARPLLAYTIAVKLLVAPLAVPATGWLLAKLIATSGRTAVSNTDVVFFLMTPVGLLAGAVAGIAVLSAALLEHTGALAIIALKFTGHRVTVRRAIVVVLAGIVRVLRLGAVQLGVLVLVFTPFLVLAALTYLALVSRNDINYYLSERPPAFWAAAGVAAVLVVAALVVGAILYVRWALALPILIFENLPVVAALRASAERSREGKWRIGTVLIGWNLLGAVVGTVALFGFHLFSAMALSGVGRSPAAVIPAVAGLLALHGVLTGGLEVAFVIGHCLLLWRLYLEYGGRLEPVAEVIEPVQVTPGCSRWTVRLFVGGSLAVAAAAVLLSAGLVQTMGEPASFEITGHRCHPRAAPENSLSALRAAIVAGADWAELDVQLTADDEIVVLHDADFRRVAHVARKPGEMTLAEVKRLDIGRPFGPEFTGERVPTLAEMIAAARGRIKLNIELKFYGRDRRLAAKVADLLRAEQFEDECIVASLNYEGVRETKRHNPRLRTAAIVSAAVGDLGRLDVDALSVSRAVATDKLLGEAARLGKEVIVWTIDDAEDAERFVERGVRNLITNDPDWLVQFRRERGELTEVQRLLLAARHLLSDD
jgi:glycerophosphoryl diester phosphodiesterase